MALEVPDLTAGLQVPAPDRGIGTAREETAAVGREGDARDLPLVPRELAQLLSRLQVPEADETVVVGGQDALAVGREGQAVDGCGPLAKAEHALAPGDVP